MKIWKYLACIGELAAASAVKPTISLRNAFKLIFNTWRKSSSEVQINNALHRLVGTKSNSVEKETMRIYLGQPTSQPTVSHHHRIFSSSGQVVTFPIRNVLIVLYQLKVPKVNGRWTERICNHSLAGNELSANWSETKFLGLNQTWFSFPSDRRKAWN